MTRRTSSKLIATALSLFIAAAAWAPAASAGGDRFVFNYRSIDLDHVIGAETVYHTLVDQAARYCRLRGLPKSHVARAQHRCRERVVNEVVETISKDWLTLIHADEAQVASCAASRDAPVRNLFPVFRLPAQSPRHPLSPHIDRRGGLCRPTALRDGPLRT